MPPPSPFSGDDLPMRLRAAAIAIAFLHPLAARAADPPRRVALPAEPSPAAYSRLAGEIEEALRVDVVEAWFPRALDEQRGGFHATFSRDWTRGEDDGKSTVFQARMTWIAAQVAIHRPELRDEFLPHVRRGVAVLDEKLWDQELGGFFWKVGDDGSPTGPAGKHLYPQAFGIFAASAAYEATGDRRALDLATRAWRWIEAHGHDPANGGYFEMLRPDGTPMPFPAAGEDVPRAGKFVAGLKTSDTHLHLLEAHTQLYRVWKEPPVRERLEELLAVVRDRLTVTPGCLYAATHADWRPLPDRISFGHDVEAAFLMVEAAEALGRPRDEATLRTARMLVDHALAWGFDGENGGLAEVGLPLQKATGQDLAWWIQVEALNSFSLMHSLFGAETGRYWAALAAQWEFVRRVLIDPLDHGLYETVARNGRRRDSTKGQEWKAAYHDGRAFLLTARRLRALAADHIAK